MAVKNNLLRLMTEDDLAEVVALEKRCYPTPWSLQQFVAELENPVAAIILCEQNGELAGYVCYWLVAGELQILNVATAPQFRRQGVAGQLLTRVFAECQSSGLSSAWLEVRSGNSGAIKLYQRLGFVANGVRRSYYRDGEDALLMVKEFAEYQSGEK